MPIIGLNITPVYSSIEMISKTTTVAFVILALTAAVMLSSVVVLIPQANAATRIHKDCNNEPHPPPCGKKKVL
jgi:hypothetical protein